MLLGGLTARYGNGSKTRTTLRQHLDPTSAPVVPEDLRRKRGKSTASGGFAASRNPSWTGSRHRYHGVLAPNAPPRAAAISSPASVSHHVHPRFRPPAVRPSETGSPSRCRTRTSSSSPSRTSTMIGASPG